jgi:hypothetical protein
MMRQHGGGRRKREKNLNLQKPRPKGLAWHLAFPPSFLFFPSSSFLSFTSPYFPVFFPVT